MALKTMERFGLSKVVTPEAEELEGRHWSFYTGTSNLDMGTKRYLQVQE